MVQITQNTATLFCVCFFLSKEWKQLQKSEKGNSFCYENGCHTERIYRACDMFHVVLSRESERKKSFMLVWDQSASCVLLSTPSDIQQQ